MIRSQNQEIAAVVLLEKETVAVKEQPQVVNAEENTKPIVGKRKQNDAKKPEKENALNDVKKPEKVKRKDALKDVEENKCTIF